MSIATLILTIVINLSPTLGIATYYRHPDHDPLGGSGTLACYHRSRRVRELVEHNRMRDNLPIAAHPYWACGTRALVCSLLSGKCTEVLIADRGPRNRTLDLSLSTMRRIKGVRRGVVPVVILRLDRGDQHLYPEGTEEVRRRKAHKRNAREAHPPRKPLPY